MKYCFYVTNHGYGHASRVTSIIERVIDNDNTAEIVIKSDSIRCDFIRRHFSLNETRVSYFDDCSEVGVILLPGSMQVDVCCLKTAIISEQTKWDEIVKREALFLKKIKPDLVISDIICWAFPAAKEVGIPSVLITSFTWETVYRSFFDQEVFSKYSEYYRMADFAIWYDIYDKELDKMPIKQYKVSVVSRKYDERNVERIRQMHSRPIVFVSLGGSAYLDKTYDVSNLEYDFITTEGIDLVGSNVFKAPRDMINTVEIIAASQLVIAKGGWSTVAEILLQQKKCGLIFRSKNNEDEITRKSLERRRQCVSLDGTLELDFPKIINEVNDLEPVEYTYINSSLDIAKILFKLAGGGGVE